MFISAVKICHNSLHQPFASEGAVKIQNLNSERPALKIIRAVLRESGVDAEDAVSYSIHKCYCNIVIKIDDQDQGRLDPTKTLDELGIEDGDSVFIRKIDGANEMELMADQTSTLKRSSRKRKEEADHETLQSEFQMISPGSVPTSVKTESTSDPSKGPAAIDKIFSNLENLASGAAATARSISKLLGGDGWKSQSIGILGPIQTIGQPALGALLRLVKTSHEIPQLSGSDRSGLFNSDLIEALTRACYQRVGSSRAKSGQNSFFNLGLPDYERANELLKGKIEGNGSWERGSLSHLDESSLSNPASRFPLNDTELFGQNLRAARAICVLWNNDKWLTEAPLPGLSPISLKDPKRNAILRQIAELTRVKPGEATPDGLPSIVLRALQEAIRQRESSTFFNLGKGSRHGWSQSQDILKALEILKNNVKEEEMAGSTSSDNRPHKKMKIGSLLNPQVL